MSPERVPELKRRLRAVWVMSPERLWRASIAAQQRGRWVLAFSLKQLGGLLYHNSLSPGASVSDDFYLGHNSIGIVVSPNVEIGRRVVIWHNVTLTAGRPLRRGEPADPDARVIVEDDVIIGANAVVIAPRGKSLRIGRGASIGAGTVVTKDVPARVRIVGAAPRLLADEESDEGEGELASPSPASARESRAEP